MSFPRRKKSGAEPRRRARGGDEFLVGKTIAGATRMSHTMSVERKKQQQREKRKTALRLGMALVLTATVIVVIVGVAREVEIRHENEKAELARKASEPTIEIVDENADGETSVRVKEFIVRVETEVARQNLKIDHAVLPHQKAREVIFFMQGREEYYKFSVDRGAAVQVEDMTRMMGFIDENAIQCSYVDLRVEGRAYYR